MATETKKATKSAPAKAPAKNEKAKKPAKADPKPDTKDVKKGGSKQAPSKKKASPKNKAPAKASSSKKPAGKSTKQAGGAKKQEKKGGAQKKVQKKVEQPKEAGDGKKRSRFFKVIYDEHEATGRFSGTKPKQAANKALTSILKTRQKEGKGVEGEIKFCIVECTRGSKQKKYYYVGERKKLDTEMVITIGKDDDAKKIVYRFANTVKKDKTVDNKA